MSSVDSDSLSDCYDDGMPLLGVDQSHYDVIVVGTGVIESVIASSIARAGKRVLHLDCNNYYGDSLTSFALSQFMEWMSFYSENDKTVTKANFGYSITEDLFDDHEFVIPNHQNHHYDSLVAESRDYSIDVSPKLFFCRGPLIESLVKSGIGRYLEFRVIECVAAMDASSFLLQRVPCSKSDVFQDRSIGVLEKRALMKFLHQCIDTNLDSDVTFDGNFNDYLVSLGIRNEKLRHVIIHAIALHPSSDYDQLNFKQGLSLVRRYLMSLGRWGKTAFLCGYYGVGDLTQAFCRMSAVYGATYILSRGLSKCDGVRVGNVSQRVKHDTISLPYDSAVTNNDNVCLGVTTSRGEVLHSPFIVLGSRYYKNQFNVPLRGANTGWTKICRCVLIITSALSLEGEAVPDRGVDERYGGDGTLLLAVIPPCDASSSAIHLLQYDWTAKCCPKNKYVVHLSTQASLAEDGMRYRSAKECFSVIVNKLFFLHAANSDENSGKESQLPEIIWGAYYSRWCPPAPSSSNVARGVYCVPDMDPWLPIDGSYSPLSHPDGFVIGYAKTVFKDICGEQTEFLSEIPDPEESADLCGVGAETSGSVPPYAEDSGDTETQATSQVEMSEANNSPL